MRLDLLSWLMLGIVVFWLLVYTASLVHAASTCYLYEGDAYWTCLREERADEQALEELREQIAQDTREALEEVQGEGAFK